MPGKRSKNAGYIDLTRDEYNIVTAQKVGRVINEFKRQELIGSEVESVA
jgi:hypothetical protein